MKFLSSQLIQFLRHRPSRRNLDQLARFLLLLVALVTLHSLVFHFIMAYEGREYSWITGFYWTLTVMSTLGFGDITFHSDLGRAYSIFVLLSGMVFLLVLLPFTFIEFFYDPWMKAQSAARVPREAPVDLRNHVILTHHDEVTAALIPRLTRSGYPYLLLAAEPQEVVTQSDLGISAMLGDLDDPDTYRRARADQAAMVVATGSDPSNTSVAFTVREISATVPIVTIASQQASVDILELAGSSHVLQLGRLLGQSLARRVGGGSGVTRTLGQVDELRIAEATVSRTPLVGKTVAGSRLREHTGVAVVGVWEHGRFEIARPQTPLGPHTVLVLAGGAEALARYDELFCIYNVSTEPVVILGGGRVGRATGRALAERGMDYRIVERNPARIRDPEHYVAGDAAEIEVLERAGIMRAPAIAVTTHDDETNVYLTIYCRRLCPDTQIISRATLERNVSTLHRAGADFVVSYAGMGSNAAFNLLRRGRVEMLAEGLMVYRVPAPDGVVGRAVSAIGRPDEQDWRLVAVRDDGRLRLDPEPSFRVPAGAELVIVGGPDAEQHFLRDGARG